MVNGRKKRKESFINLPPLDKGNLCDEGTIAEFVVKATISADPILDANNCVVVVIYEGSCKLAFIRLNKDTTWTYVDPRLEYIGQSLDMIEDVVHVKEKFYAVKVRRFLAFGDENRVTKKGCLHHDFGVYDVKSQCFSQPCAPNIKALMKMTKKPPYWVVPTFQL
ncbi:hypothetical protein L3X38_014886 [Prunus dulcis]|uniref:KIB1-4 beta-propeller domain-containing protein n=1 Tax=Prunus dulcis TaxID=3755 RepID=A0AAD4WR67_PRUDU|nr:hypothetical protein L3X38_014886 [Prunus dulcis]